MFKQDEDNINMIDRQIDSIMNEKQRWRDMSDMNTEENDPEPRNARIVMKPCGGEAVGAQRHHTCDEH